MFIGVKMKLKLLLTLFLACHSSVATENNSINVIGYAPHPAIEQHYLQIVKESYARLGIYPDFIPVSDKRSFKMLSQNRLDGLVVRTENILNEQDNYISVPPSLGMVEITLICQQSIACNKKLFDDPNKILGLVAQEAYYQELLKNKAINVYEIGDYKRMEQMFEQNKLDAMIMVFDLNTQNITSLGLNTFTLAKRKGFHMIHKRFRHLIPNLTQSLSTSLAAHKFN